MLAMDLLMILGSILSSIEGVAKGISYASVIGVFVFSII